MPDSTSAVVRWLPAARGGCSQALGEVLQACRRYLLWIARQELDPGVRVKGSASDIVQETFLDAHRDFQSFQGGSEEELLAWLRQLLLNNLSNFTRRYRATAKRQVAGEQSLTGIESGSGPGGELESADLAPDEQAIRREQRELLRRAVQRLPEDYRQIVTWWHEDACSFEEIGRRLNRSGNAVRVKWLRAIEQLQGALEDNDGTARPGVAVADVRRCRSA